MYAYSAGEARAEVERLHVELKASQRATDVEYFARQCDRRVAEELAARGCPWREAPP